MNVAGWDGSDREIYTDDEAEFHICSGGIVFLHIFTAPPNLYKELHTKTKSWFQPQSIPVEKNKGYTSK